MGIVLINKWVNCYVGSLVVLFGLMVKDVFLRFNFEFFGNNI